MNELKQSYQLNLSQIDKLSKELSVLKCLENPNNEIANKLQLEINQLNHDNHQIRLDAMNVWIDLFLKLK